MSQNLQYYDEELTELENDITKSMLAAKRLKGEEKTQKLEYATQKLDEAGKKFKKYKRQIEKLEASEQRKYEEKKKQHQNELFKLTSNLEATKTENARKELMGEPTADKGDNNDEKGEKKKGGKKKRDSEVTVNQRTGKTKIKDKELEDELFKEIFETQDKSLAICARLIAKSDETIEIAQESAELLTKQREQLLRIDAKMDELGDNITRGRKEIVSFLRKLATDWVIMIIIIVIVLGIIALIVWQIVQPFVKKIQAITPVASPPTAPAPTSSVFRL